VYHFNTAGQQLGYFDTNSGAGSLFPECATNGVTGIAAGPNALYLTTESCGAGFQFAKSDSGAGTKLSSFSVAGTQSGGAACDNVSFPGTTALWVRDAATGSVRAVEIASGTCFVGGGLQPNTSDRWMSGGGDGFGTETLAGSTNCSPPGCSIADVPHAFHLLCDQVSAGPPNNLVVNWKDPDGNHFSFHLEQWTTLACINDGFNPSPPACGIPARPDCFDQIVGSGIGRLTGRGPHGELLPIGGTCNPRTNDVANCGTLDNFTAIDHGEPNVNDHGEFTISDPTQGGILSVCGCKRANYQAHQRPA
jgi:hypothetical protein